MIRDKYIPRNFYCDGTKIFGNADKPPDCDDGSDENPNICCEGGDYGAYDETLCFSFHSCVLG